MWLRPPPPGPSYYNYSPLQKQKELFYNELDVDVQFLAQNPGYHTELVVHIVFLYIFLHLGHSFIVISMLFASTHN